MTEPVKCVNDYANGYCLSCAVQITRRPIMHGVDWHKYCSPKCHGRSGKICMDVGGCPACDREAIWKEQGRPEYKFK